MNKGERQVAPTIDEIRKDHVNRYAFVADKIFKQNVLDCGSGVGYGSWLLAAKADHVDGLEIDDEAISYAEIYYASTRVNYQKHDINNPYTTTRQYDVAVAFEVIEHLENPRKLLTWIDAPVLYASVPNELVFPYGKGYLYHHRHYTPEQFEQLLNECGWAVNEWYGQEGAESDLVELTQGRTLIAKCTRVPDGEKIANCETWKQIPAPGMPQSKKITIVAMGSSVANYVRLASSLGTRKGVGDEVWAINAMGGCLQHDRAFHMDDLMVQESRAKNDPNGNIAGMLTWLKTHPGFYTSKSYAGYPGAIEYPLEAVCNSIDHNYFNSTVAYAVALAIHEKAQQIGFFGVDFTYKDRHQAERGRGCVEFLIGIAMARGIEIAITQDSSLLDSNESQDLRLYGYDAEHIDFKYENGRTIVTKRPRERLPTAAEIEKRYDKSGVIE
jgi:hypothetical protein